MSNIDKQDRQVQRFANYGVDMMEWADGGYVKHSDYQALLDELEAKDRRITEKAEIIAKQEKRIADQSGIIASARKFISEYAGLGDVGAAEFLAIIDRAAGTDKGE